MILLGLDFETTGLDPKTDRIIEVGAVLWDTERQTPLKMISEVINPGVELSSEITIITGLSTEDLKEYGHPKPFSVFMDLYRLLTQCDFAIAHNAPFDKSFLDAEFDRQGIVYEAQWLDSITDLPLEAYKGSRSLTYLAADHGFLNPFSHRAVFDVLTMLKVVSQYPIDMIIERSQSPTMLVQAEVSYWDRELAKKHGFKWNPEAKKWEKRLKVIDAEKESSMWEFKFASSFL